MNIDEIIAELKYNNGDFPQAAVDAAIEQYGDLKPILLNELTSLANKNELSRKYILHFFAMFILAKFREPEAYPVFVRLVSLPGETVQAVLGDIVTESLPALLASVCQGDLTLIKKLIENPEINEYVRGSAIESLLVLYAEGDLSRETIIGYFRELYTTKLEKEFSLTWGMLVAANYNIHPLELMPEIEQAFQDGFVDELYINFEGVQKCSKRNQQEVLQELDRRRYSYADNLVYALANWACYRKRESTTAQNSMLDVKPSKKMRELNFVAARTEPKVGRNDPCPCGSGKKYKKCCLGMGTQ